MKSFIVGNIKYPVHWNGYEYVAVNKTTANKVIEELYAMDGYIESDTQNIIQNDEELLEICL